MLNDCAAKQANVVQILERVSRHLSMVWWCRLTLQNRC